MSYKSAIGKLSHLSEPRTFMKYNNISDALNDGYYMLGEKNKSVANNISNVINFGKVSNVCGMIGMNNTNNNNTNNTNNTSSTSCTNSRKRKRTSQFIDDVIMNNEELDHKLILIMENLKNTYDDFEGCYYTFLKDIKKNIKCKLTRGLENEDETENDDFF